MKIIVPQELQEKIIDLYVNKQWGRARIGQVVGYNESVVKRILKENNIHIRGYEEAKVGHPKIEVPKQLQEQIIELYQRGYGLERIVEELHTAFSFNKVKTILIENGIHIRTLQEAAQVKIMPDLRQYKINDNYNFISHNGAWLLGMYAADGYFPMRRGSKNKICLALGKKDEEILWRIKNQLKCKTPLVNYIATVNGKKYPQVALNFTSKKIRQQFEKYIPVENKTENLKTLPDIPKEYIIDFIRGVWDGDGSFPRNKDRKITSNLISFNRSFVQSIGDFLKNEYNLTPHIYCTKNKYWTLVFFKEDTLRLGHLFYDNDYISLKRKKDIYLSFKKQFPTSLDFPKERKDMPNL